MTTPTLDLDAIEAAAKSLLTANETHRASRFLETPRRDRLALLRAVEVAQDAFLQAVDERDTLAMVARIRELEAENAKPKPGARQLESAERAHLRDGAPLSRALEADLADILHVLRAAQAWRGTHQALARIRAALRGEPSVTRLRSELATAQAELESVRNPWVLASERLPEEDERVLIAYFEDREGRPRVTEACYTPSCAVTHRWQYGYGCVLALGDVTHWAALPKPPGPAEKQ